MRDTNAYTYRLTLSNCDTDWQPYLHTWGVAECGEHAY
jgi:hypothetical protein